MEKIKSCDEAMDKRIAELESELQKLKDTAPSVSMSSLLRVFYESNLIPICRSQVNGRVFDCNQAYCDMVGYTHDQLVSGEVLWSQLTAPEYKHLDEESVRQIKATGRSQPYEKEYIHKDGSRITVILCCTAADNTGEDVFALFLNLSELRKSEIELARREEMFHQIVDSIPQIVYICDADGMNVEYLNQRYEDYVGLSAELALEQKWMSKIHPDDHHLIGSTTQEASSSGFMETELRQQHRDGSYHWTLTRSVPILRADGTISKWLGTATDIDEQKKIELALREREESFRLLTNAIPQIIWTASADGEIDFFNDRWLEYTGLSVEQSLSGGWQLLVHSSDFAGYMSGWMNAVKSGETYECEFRLKRAVGLSKNNNGYRWQLCRAVAMRNRSGRILKWYGTWTEIDEQKKKK
ncbi:MAG TPA: PAS domain-containing protein [Planktothrix sp.]